MSDSEKESVKAGIKEGLEGLKGKIPGLVDIKVNTSGRLPSSTADRANHRFALSRLYRKC